MTVLPSLAACYVVLSTMLLIIPVAHAQTKTTPTQEQIQAALFMHALIKNYPEIKTLLAEAKDMPDEVPGITINPLMNVLLNGMRNLANNPASEVNRPNSTSNNVTGESSSSGTNGLMTSILQNPMLRQIATLVFEQVTRGVAEAARQNQTIGNGISSYVSLIQPVELIRKLMASYVASSAMRNEASGHVSDACYHDVTYSMDSLLDGKSWAIEMLDAQGKMVPGIERGAFYFAGSYDQCYMVKPRIDTDTESRDFKTRFCRVDIAIPESLIDSLNVDTHGVHLKLTWGLCVPDSCHSQDAKGFFELEPLKRLNLTLEASYCDEEKELKSDKSAIAAICVVSVFGVLMLLGTMYDIYRTMAASTNDRTDLQAISTSNKYVIAVPKEEGIQAITIQYKTDAQNVYTSHKGGDCSLPSGSTVNLKENEMMNNNHTDAQTMEAGRLSKQPTEEPFLARVLVCFSLYTNIPKLLNAKSTPGAVSCIHGIRFLSLTWVVLGHTYNYGIISQQEAFTTQNLIDALPIMQRFTFEAVVGGGFAVDTFFVLSAFLLTWLQLKEIEGRKNKLSLNVVVMYYFHRFWRLTPIYMMVLMMFGCLYQYLGSGPFWPSVIWSAEHCKTNWWTNLLYVNNLVKQDAACMGWSWYLANDMQFYIISPLFLIFMYKIPVVGAVITAMLLCMGMSLSFWKEYEANGTFFTMISDDGAYWKNVYIAPWCRVGAWAVGMLLGFMLFKRGRKPIKTKRLVFAGWAAAFAVAMVIVYSPYNENKEDGEKWNNTQHAFYEALGRPAWGMCISWVIFACYSHMGGIINSVLSWNGFIPLSRLTYAAYLVHPICMMIYFSSRRTLFYVNDYSIIYLFLGHLCITYMVAFVCSLAFEAPAMALEKLLFRRPRKG